MNRSRRLRGRPEIGRIVGGQSREVDRRLDEEDARANGQIRAADRQEQRNGEKPDGQGLLATGIHSVG